MSYFRNVQDNGNWLAGNSYTIEEYFFQDVTQDDGGNNRANYGGILIPGLNVLVSSDYTEYVIDTLSEFDTGPLEHLDDTKYIDLRSYITITGADWDIYELIIPGPPNLPYLKVYGWRTRRIDLPVDFYNGNYSLIWFWFKFSHIDELGNFVYETIESEIYNITITNGIERPPDPIIPPVPDDRPEDYNFDFFWVPGSWDGDEYTPPHFDEEPTVIVAAGGGRWSKNLVAAGNGKIYYEDYS